MKKKILSAILVMATASIFSISCKKEISQQKQPLEEEISTADRKGHHLRPSYDLNVTLRGNHNRSGHIKFRQDPDPAKIITLDTRVHHLEPNRAYLLQRAVDAINVIDGNCTSTSWLTLGKGLTPQSIFTDARGKGSEELWRDVSAVQSGSVFDIHFRVIDAVTSAVVLTSDCYQYQVR